MFPEAIANVSKACEVRAMPLARVKRCNGTVEECGVEAFFGMSRQAPIIESTCPGMFSKKNSI
jgi:hypothetical protein